MTTKHRCIPSSWRRTNAAFPILLLSLLLLEPTNVAAFQPVASPSIYSAASFSSSRQQQRRVNHVNTAEFYYYSQPLLYSQSQKQTTALNMIPFSGAGGGEMEVLLSSFLTSVLPPTFDGNSIVDPVIVSNAFWDGLTRQFVSLILGQFLAATVFGLLATFASSQMNNLKNFVTENIFGQNNQGSSSSGSTTKGLKQPPPGYTGPPLKVAPDLPKLLICITIDLIGTSSELIPFVGELTDIIWAPVGAWLLRSLYGGSNIIFALEFTEEILPFTDILPLATICWTVDTFFRDSNIAKFLQLGIYRQGQENINGAGDISTKKKNDRLDDDKFIRGRGFIDVEPENFDRRK